MSSRLASTTWLMFGADDIPLVSEIPTIIFGADVTHPENGEDSSPSIAAVVASQDWPEVTKYAGLVCAQAHRQELIQDLYKTWHDPVRGTVSGGMIWDLLVSFHKATGQKPLRIIFYRLSKMTLELFGFNDLTKGHFMFLTKLLISSLQILGNRQVITLEGMYMISVGFNAAASYAFTDGETVAQAVSELCPLLAFTFILNGIQPVLSGNMVRNIRGQDDANHHINMGYLSDRLE